MLPPKTQKPHKCRHRSREGEADVAFDAPQKSACLYSLQKYVLSFLAAVAVVLAGVTAGLFVGL